MEDLYNIRKENIAERVKATDVQGIRVPNENVSQLEQKLNLVEELKKLTVQIQGVEESKGIKGLNYEDLCIQPDVELSKGYKPPKFEMFDGTGDARVHIRTYCDKLVGVGKDGRIPMKLFMRGLERDALSWYISQDPKKWSSWVGMSSDFMDRFRFNTENVLDVFYIQNLKKKPTETFREYATRWRSEAAKFRPTLEEEQMNKFFVRAQDPQYYERLMMIENHKFSDTIKLGERIEESIKRCMVTNFKALQSTNKALQSGGVSKKRDLYERLKAAGYVTPIPAATPENPSQRSLIDDEIILANEPAPNVCNNPLPDHKGGGIYMIEVEDDWDPEGSIGLIAEGDDPKKPTITLNPIIVQILPSEDAELNMSISLEFEVAPSAKTPTPIEVEFVSPANAPGPFEVAVLPPKAHVPFEVRIATPILVAMSTMPPFYTNTVPWDYTAEARRKGKVLNEVYVPSDITRGEVANMVGQVLESHKISFYEDKLPPEGLGHNKALHITVQCEDYFVTRNLIDGGSSLNICLLVTLKKLGKGLHEINDGAINIKAFNGS
ncbi:uncharacterized protein [Nicotiana sylvestris]|uniref:uncharacterized protein n=1 Tax=Nicotiana sylvestris TaxID=4096 RepID=UPI00388C7215